MCKQCQAVNICGIPTHEYGCPLGHLHAWTGEAQPRECKWCGSEFLSDERDQKFCSTCCYASYNGHECSCESCEAFKLEMETRAISRDEEEGGA